MFVNHKKMPKGTYFHGDMMVQTEFIGRKRNDHETNEQKRLQRELKHSASLRT